MKYHSYSTQFLYFVLQLHHDGYRRLCHRPRLLMINGDGTRIGVRMTSLALVVGVRYCDLARVSSASVGI